MKTTIIAGALAAGCALCWGAKDPVLMYVNGTPVALSEFEYLYNKNSQQQLNAQPVDEYLDLFEIYKLKVADAKAARIDTTASFRKDMDGYRRDLSKPYMTDSTYLLNLVQETFDHSREEVEARHIMIMKSRDHAANKAARARIDSIHQRLMEGDDFGQLAYDHSDDRTAKTNRGTMGYITAGMYPYAFEKHAYELKEGEISEVFETPFGYHIMKGGKHRPARGTVLAAHIMKMLPAGADAKTEARVKASIDSLYNVVAANPASFPSVAAANSEDPGSAQKGGELPWFGAGRMVAEFDSAAFALEKGEISHPFRTQFGYHIVKKLDARGPESYEEVKQNTLRMISSPQDERYRMVRDNTSARLAKKHKGRVNQAVLDRLKERASNGIDSTFYVDCTVGELASLPILTIGKTDYPVDQFMVKFRNQPQPDPEVAAQLLENSANSYLYNNLVSTEEEWLDKNVADYHNLLNEYSEGSLLYEISVQKVWDKAAKDTEGLNAFFEANRSNYAWSEPHAKGILIQAKDDSVADVIRRRLPELGNDTIMQTLRREFKDVASAERILAKQGENAMVDNIVFGGPAVTPSAATYTVYFMWEPRVINEPEEPADVRGLVTSDYQNELEREWVDELKARYPIEVNRKVLDKVRKKKK